MGFRAAREQVGSESERSPKDVAPHKIRRRWHWRAGGWKGPGRRQHRNESSQKGLSLSLRLHATHKYMRAHDHYLSSFCSIHARFPHNIISLLKMPFYGWSEGFLKHAKFIILYQPSTSGQCVCENTSGISVLKYLIKFYFLKKNLRNSSASYCVLRQAEFCKPV